MLSLLAFLLYHPNSARGPDSDVYLGVAHSILTTGSLNILPESRPYNNTLQITKTGHAPIHQNIGGVVFILPAAALAHASRYVAGLIPGLPPAFSSITYHDAIWCGCMAYLLALLSIFLLYRVALVYHRESAVLGALVAIMYGGPLLVYVAVYPCQTNLPSFFMAALLLYMFHFADRGLFRSWLLLGSVWSLGTFVRIEFSIWGLLLLYALVQEWPKLPWRAMLQRTALLACGCLLFTLPVLQIRQVLFGSQGSTYAPQLDVTILLKSYLMLFGPRNGLFVFWPILAVALLGYLIRLRRNPSPYHVLMLILLLGTLVCGTTPFWSGDLGDSFGQRRFLFLLPCFSLFLARLFDEMRKRFMLLGVVAFSCAGWALLMFAAYGGRWNLPEGGIGFLMPNHHARILQLVLERFPELASRALSLALFPKHVYALLLLPLWLSGALLVACISRRFSHRQLLGGCLIALLCGALLTTTFLAGAKGRGERVFESFAARNPRVGFVQRNYEVSYEIIGSLADRMAFFTEMGDMESVRDSREKGMRFLRVEAPDQVERFERICQALQLRQELGWYRLMPEQSLEAMEQWYDMALANSRQNLAPPDERGAFRY